MRNATRWHRLTTGNLDTVRALLGPRAPLTVWPDLSPDVDAVLAALPADASMDFVWEEPTGMIRHVTIDETDHHHARHPGRGRASGLRIAPESRRATSVVSCRPA
ncbi:hypothetical protein [Streptomyces sp. KL116D]|uniref:hypothetical protein n=2 Tax=Streptomyces sp. KL116D TaxID=3045152 RepID=UPI003556CA0F